MAGRRGVLLGFISAAVVAAACAVVEPTAAAAATGQVVPSCHKHPATIFGPGNLVGTRGRDVIVGTLRDGSLGQTIKARGGDDLVCAGRFGAVLFGGGGDDRLFGRGGDTADILNGGPGDDLLNPGSGVGPCCADEFSFQGGKHGVTVDLKKGRATGQGDDRLVVSAGANTVEGTAHRDILRGTDADDAIFPGAGNDVVRGRGGNDHIYNGSGDDILYGGTGRDNLFACNGSIFGGPGGDTLQALLGFYSCEEDLQTPYEAVKLSGGKGPDFVRFFFALRDGDDASGGPGADELEVFFGVTDHANPIYYSPLVGDLTTGSFTQDRATRQLPELRAVVLSGARRLGHHRKRGA